MEFYSTKSSYSRRVGVGITHQGGSTPTSMRNRRCKNVSTIPGRISDTCDIERDFNGIVYHGPTAEKKIYLYYHDNHYDVITSMTAFIKRIYFCASCYKGITPKKNTLAATYVIIAGRFTIKLKMIG